MKHSVACTCQATRGSHRQFHHPTKSGTVTVAGKLSVNIPPGTLKNVLKQAGMTD
nr:type II toxin-antitoxin system HicA family toxin [uncultured Thiohalocapsa sp.]